MAAANEQKIHIELPSDREIVMTRTFNAPPHLVFAAWTKPELVRQWWACMEGYEMTRCEIDLRVGGQWVYAMRGEGQEHRFKGEYKEIVPNQKLVHTEIYDVEPFNAEAALVTSTFEHRGDQTFVRSVILHESTQGRDGHLQSGMEYGANLAWDRLEEVARDLATAA